MDHRRRERRSLNHNEGDNEDGEMEEGEEEEEESKAGREERLSVGRNVFFPSLNAILGICKGKKFLAKFVSYLQKYIAIIEKRSHSELASWQGAVQYIPMRVSEYLSGASGLRGAARPPREVTELQDGLKAMLMSMQSIQSRHRGGNRSGGTVEKRQCLTEIQILLEKHIDVFSTVNALQVASVTSLLEMASEPY